MPLQSSDFRQGSSQEKEISQIVAIGGNYRRSNPVPVNPPGIISERNKLERKSPRHTGSDHESISNCNDDNLRNGDVC